MERLIKFILDDPLIQLALFGLFAICASLIC